MQDEENDGDNDQNVNPATNFREARADSTTEKAKQPKHEQNDDDSPQHEIAPFERSIFLESHRI
jgi:rubredoxin